jgi:RNA polymerase sigma-70 factor, ECF subfamily
MTQTRQVAFDALVRKLGPELYRFAYWLCKNQALAHDILQECYLRAWKSSQDLADLLNAKAWLMTILRREFLRTFERKQFDLTDLDDVAIADTSTPGLDEQNDTSQLRQMIGRLDAKYRVPLVLQVIGGLSGAEISAELGISEATVNTQLFRARDQLKAMLDAPQQASEALKIGANVTNIHTNQKSGSRS